MANAVQRIGALRDRIRIERRSVVPDDGAGNTEGDWGPVIGGEKLSAEIRELNGGESVIAAKLSGNAVCLVVLRASEATRSITPTDRIIDLTNDRVLNVRHAPPQDRRRYIVLTCESGVADG